MKNLSIITQIAIINICIMAIFIGIFIFRNYTIVSNQLILLEDEKIDSIVKTSSPIICINMTLGLEENLKEIIKDSMQIHDEIVAIEIFDNTKNRIFTNLKKENIDSNTKIYETDLKDSILHTSIGQMRVYYTFSTVYSKLLQDFYLFLFWMFFFFFFSLFLSTFFIKLNLKPLKNLKDKMLNYSLNEETSFQEEDAKNEIAIINNSTVKMIKKIESEVKKTLLYEKEMMQKNRLASMGEMIDNIAHQWRQPLLKINALLLNTDRAIELKKHDDKYLQDKINEISNTVFFMSNTIDTFREFLNPNRSKLEFEISNSLEKSIEFSNISLKDIEINFNKNEYTIKSFENEFIQVIITILSNAVDIFEERNIKNKILNINIYEDEFNIFIEIEDNAKGIDEKIIEQIFDPYFTTKHKVGGTGMGLYIAKMIIINNLKGDIHVVNTKIGAKFILKISKE